MTQAEIAALWDRLHAELTHAEREHRRIQEEMDRIMFASADGTPLSDGLYRRMKAGTEARAAFTDYQRTVERFQAFIDKGIVPGDI